MVNRMFEKDSNAIKNAQAEATTAMNGAGATAVDLARLGLSELAYIRRALVDNVPMWTIHNAAGDPLGAAESFDQAWAAVIENNLEPVRVH